MRDEYRYVVCQSVGAMRRTYTRNATHGHLLGYFTLSADDVTLLLQVAPAVRDWARKT